MLTRPLKWIANLVMKPWYTFINRADVEGVLHFMNYGYHDDSDPLELNPEDENERYPIQLYHHTASYANLADKDLLEIGCGRGGGLSYLFRYLKPGSAHGVDLNTEAVEFCRKTYPDISFTVMDAQNLSFPDSSFDAVVNVESSHRYPDFRRFLGEVHRVLRPGGHLLITDFRYSRLVEEMLQEIRDSGFRTLRSEVINKEVLSALERDSGRRIDLVKKHLPRLLHPAAREFAGTTGTRLYRSFRDEARCYICLALQKETSTSAV